MHALLEEMGHKFFMPALRMLAFVIRKGLRHISKGIYVNKEGVDMVCGSQNSVVVLMALTMHTITTMWPFLVLRI